jgi:aminoacrylate hydrolase
LADRLGELFGHDLADLPPVAAAQLRALRRAEATGRLSHLSQTPTLVVSASDDLIAPPAAGRRLADEIPNAPWSVISGAGHGLPITHPAVVNELLRAHLHDAEAAWQAE